MRSFVIALSTLLLSIAAGFAPAVGAAIHVTRCQTDVEPGGQNLRDALHHGGEIVFDCPGGRATIQMTMEHVLPPNVTLDGGNNITLDGGGRALRLFVVPQGDFTALNITVKNVRATRSSRRFGHRLYPSVLQVRNGTAVLKHVTIRDSELAVDVENAKVSSSRFVGNSNTALEISEKADVSDTTFRGNEIGVRISGGSVRGNTFSDNKQSALRVMYPRSPVEIVKNYFHGNSGDGTVLLSQRSDAANGSQLVRFARNTFEDNSSERRGGAISIYDTVAGTPSSATARLLIRYPPSRFEFNYDKFVRNRGPGAGAIYADLFNTQGMRIVGGIFVGNESTGGRAGAISWGSASVAVSHSAFIGNRAGIGAAIWADSIGADDHWQIVNSIFTRNVAGPGGGIIAVGPVKITNVTIARNDGIGFTGDAHGSTPDLPLIANSILSENTQGNCRGINPDRFLGRNLQFGVGDCPSIPVVDPLLDQMLIPQLGGPALIMGDLDICLSDPVRGKDLLFQTRGSAGVCALGAFEYAPHDLVGPMLGEPR
ncbi:hypothetical protein ATY76_01080 [Rhizobium sp. R339]|uniref:right-handed parallel beta-helix repeat-containing protein n=1 Tax=Rhizobium sp. R339 TaxID=1764273 RepID=UPI000B532B88|nr:right-handed parallel beta-helix repeat-containing protein [Rhizobium sp. R339]OWV76580.1 hypothetical protein ATY76_01080 [Rhizobium sp. R339]